MIVDQLSVSWRVDPFNEDHPAVFERWRLRDLTTVDAAIAGSRGEVVLFKPVLDSPMAVQLLDRYPDARVLWMSRRHHDVVNSAAVMFGAENWHDRVHKWMARDFREFDRCGVPAATADAVRALWDPDLDPVSATALYWYFYNRIYLDLGLAAHPRARLLVYEDLVKAPRAGLLAIERALGVELALGERITMRTSSVGRDDPPEIRPDIDAACHELRAELEAVAQDCG